MMAYQLVSMTMPNDKYPSHPNSRKMSQNKVYNTSPITFSSPSPSLLFGRSMILKETSAGILLVGSNKSIQLTLVRFCGGVGATFDLGGHFSLKRSCKAQPSSSWNKFTMNPIVKQLSKSKNLISSSRFFCAQKVCNQCLIIMGEL